MFFLKRLRKSMSLLVIMAMSLSLIGTAGAASVSDDLNGHWAEAAMRKCVQDGLLRGYDDGTYRPERPVTRAEFASLVNRAFQLTDTADISFKDLPQSNWAHREIAAAVKAGYVKGYEDGSFRPNKNVTREEAASMVAALLELDVEASVQSDATNKFADAALIADWSRAAIAALVDAQLMAGMQDGRFAPQAVLTRAQAVTLLEKALGYEYPSITYDIAGEYGPDEGTETIKGNVIVSAADVTLQNVVIEGDLTVTGEVGEGDVFFKGIQVKGTTNIQGGGENSVHFEDSILLQIIVDKQNGSVRVVASGATAIRHTVVHSPVKLE